LPGICLGANSISRSTRKPRAARRTARTRSNVRQLREARLLAATRAGASSSYRVERSRLRAALQGAQDALLPALTTES
jgi:hypothetical protein